MINNIIMNIEYIGRAIYGKKSHFVFSMVVFIESLMAIYWLHVTRLGLSQDQTFSAVTLYPG